MLHSIMYAGLIWFIDSLALKSDLLLAFAGVLVLQGSFCSMLACCKHPRPHASIADPATSTHCLRHLLLSLL